MQRFYGRNRPGLVKPKRGDGGEVGEEVREVTGEEGRLYGALFVIKKKKLDFCSECNKLWRVLNRGMT